MPLYRELAKSDRLSLRVVHGNSPDMPNCEGDGFETVEVREKLILGGKAIWHRAQMDLASKDQCDVLVFSGNIRYASLLPALRKCRKNGVASVLWGHHNSKAGGKTADFIRKNLLFKNSDCILCYSHQVADRIRTSPELTEKTFVAPNAVDQSPIKIARSAWLKQPEKLNAFRQEQGLGGGPNLLFVSRIKPRNKLENLIEILAQTRKAHPQTTASIIGAHNEEQARIHNLAKQRGLEKAVFFPGAIYDEMELAPWFMCADVFLYPAQIGLSLFHAFGYGTPVVAGTHPKNQNPELEALRDGENGFRFDDTTPEEATKQISRILNDPELRNRLSEGALRTIMEDFNIQTMAQHYLEAILFAAKNRGDRSENALN